MERDPGTEEELTSTNGHLSFDCQNYLEAQNEKTDSPLGIVPMQGPDGQLQISYITGTNNTHTDFRVEEGEKLMYMMKKTMYLKVQEHGELRDIMIREGDIFLLPARIPHCALPFEDTVCMVIQRQGVASEPADYTRYATNENPTNLFNPNVQQWRSASQSTRSNKPTSAEPALTAPHETDPADLPEQFWPDDRGIDLPFNLKTMLGIEGARIEKEGKIRLFDGDCESDVYAVGGKKRVEFESNNVAASWVWQFRGTAKFVCYSQESDVYSLMEGGSFFVPPGLRIAVEQQGEETSYTIVVTMDPRNKSQIDRGA